MPKYWGLTDVKSKADVYAFASSPKDIEWFMIACLVINSMSDKSF